MRKGISSESGHAARLRGFQHSRNGRVSSNRCVGEHGEYACELKLKISYGVRAKEALRLILTQTEFDELTAVAGSAGCGGRFVRRKVSGFLENRGLDLARCTMGRPRII